MDTTNKKKTNGIRFTYVTNQELLLSVCDELKKYPIIGIDIECENNLHHYGIYISLIQISTGYRNFIIDVLAVKNVDPILEILRNEKIQKIIHDVSFDFRVLDGQFKCRVKNVFDTQIAALLLGKKELGLGALLEEYFSVKKQSLLQMADWTKRPIPFFMLQYAIKDTIYLTRLREILIKELKDKGRYNWALEEFRYIEKRPIAMNGNTFSDMKGLKDMTDTERAILRRLYNIREGLAKKVNKPVHFIISTKKMRDLAKNPPKTLRDWKRIDRVHPIVREMAEKFFNAVNLGKKEKLPHQRRENGKLKINENSEFERYMELRARMASDLKIADHLIMSKEQIQDIINTGTTRCLRTWQRELYEKYSKMH